MHAPHPPLGSVCINSWGSSEREIGLLAHIYLIHHIYMNKFYQFCFLDCFQEATAV